MQEIKRTAEANGGAPLGTNRFEKETGIKAHDWLGKHWARWGDALREAGFSPNTMQAAYDESFLLEKYIELARELGKLPVKGDMLMKVKHSPGFPHAKVFRRFGSKAGLVKRLLDYSANRDGHEDIAAMCAQYVPRLSDETEITESVGVEMGFVYLMKSGNAYKIGRSNAAGRREYELAIQLPEKLKTVHVIRTDDPPGIETYWHNRFASKRKNGEWFDLDASDISAFKRRKFM